ncbi:DUF3558 domain-containing protein [Nocardia sp. NBC_01329]|nr:DUF3558 domain-containing protein [Nocardia sp. NBC_01329]
MAVVGLVTGCASSESAEPTPATPSKPVTSTAESSAAPAPAAEGIGVSVPPAPGNAVPGEVAFDPCFEVDDSLIDRVGFDPGSRQRQAAEITGSSLLTKIGCSFRRYSTVDGEKMPIMALNITTSTESVTEIGGDKDHQILDSAPINGRPAVVYRVAATTLPACDAVIEAPDGTFGVTLTAAPGAAGAPDPCGETREVATVLASALDK